jgi:hypothetical protein
MPTRDTRKTAQPSDSPSLTPSVGDLLSRAQFIDTVASRILSETSEARREILVRVSIGSLRDFLQLAAAIKLDAQEILSILSSDLHRARYGAIYSKAQELLSSRDLSTQDISELSKLAVLQSRPGGLSKPKLPPVKDPSPLYQEVDAFYRRFIRSLSLTAVNNQQAAPEVSRLESQMRRLFQMVHYAAEPHYEPRIIREAIIAELVKNPDNIPFYTLVINTLEAQRQNDAPQSKPLPPPERVLALTEEGVFIYPEYQELRAKLLGAYFSNDELVMGNYTPFSGTEPVSAAENIRGSLGRLRFSGGYYQGKLILRTYEFERENSESLMACLEKLGRYKAEGLLVDAISSYAQQEFEKQIIRTLKEYPEITEQELPAWFTESPYTHRIVAQWRDQQGLESKREPERYIAHGPLRIIDRVFEELYTGEDGCFVGRCSDGSCFYYNEVGAETKVMQPDFVTSRGDFKGVSKHGFFEQVGDRLYAYQAKSCDIMAQSCAYVESDFISGSTIYATQVNERGDLVVVKQLAQKLQEVVVYRLNTPSRDVYCLVRAEIIRTYSPDDIFFNTSLCATQSTVEFCADRQDVSGTSKGPRRYVAKQGSLEILHTQVTHYFSSGLFFNLNDREMFYSATDSFVGVHLYEQDRAKGTPDVQHAKLALFYPNKTSYTSVSYRHAETSNRRRLYSGKAGVVIQGRDTPDGGCHITEIIPHGNPDKAVILTAVKPIECTYYPHAKTVFIRATGTDTFRDGNNCCIYDLERGTLHFFYSLENVTNSQERGITRGTTTYYWESQREDSDRVLCHYYDGTYSGFTQVAGRYESFQAAGDSLLALARVRRPDKNEKLISTAIGSSQYLPREPTPVEECLSTACGERAYYWQYTSPSSKSPKTVVIHPAFAEQPFPHKAAISAHFKEQLALYLLARDPAYPYTHPELHADLRRVINDWYPDEHSGRVVGLDPEPAVAITKEKAQRLGKILAEYPEIDPAISFANFDKNDPQLAYDLAIAVSSEFQRQERWGRGLSIIRDAVTRTRQGVRDLAARFTPNSRGVASLSLAAGARSSLRSGDPRGRDNPQTLFTFSHAVRGFLVSGVYAAYDRTSNQAIVADTSFAHDISARQDPVTATLVPTPGNSILPSFVGGQVLRERCLVTNRDGTNRDMSSSISEKGELTFPSNATSLTYSLTYPTGRISVAELSEGNYRKFVQRLPTSYINPWGKLPDDVAAYVRSLSSLPPLERARKITAFIHSITRYDMDNGDVSDAKDRLAIGERFEFMRHRASALNRKGGAKKEFAGVCIDVNLLLVEAFKHSGLYAALVLGFAVKGSKTTLGNAHAIAALPWPQSDGSIKIVPFDATPPGDDGVSLFQFFQEMLNVEQPREEASQPQHQPKESPRPIAMIAVTDLELLTNGALENLVRQGIDITLSAQEHTALERLYQAAQFSRSEKILLSDGDMALWATQNAALYRHWSTAGTGSVSYGEITAHDYVLKLIERQVHYGSSKEQALRAVIRLAQLSGDILPSTVAKEMLLFARYLSGAGMHEVGKRRIH